MPKITFFIAQLAPTKLVVRQSLSATYAIFVLYLFSV